MEEIRNYSLREVIFTEGSDSEGIYIVKSGEILCLKSFNDRLIPIYRAKAGDIIGESGVLSDAPHTYSAISVDSGSLVFIPSRYFTKVMDEAPEWVQDVTKTMLSRLDKTSSLIAQNRILHESILTEDQYPPQLENDFKELLFNKE